MEKTSRRIVVGGLENSVFEHFEITKLYTDAKRRKLAL